jgi:hypothetical protein
MCGELAMYVVFTDNIEPSSLTKNENKRKQIYTEETYDVVI